jgi:hypothetical protein
MFYAGDEYADDACTSCPLDWAEQFYIDDEATDLDDVPDDPFAHLEAHRFLDGIEEP